MKAIYRLDISLRGGSLTGIFVAEQDHVKILLSTEISIYWGEVMGKHSTVYGQ
jgi:hypothetical protein